MPGYTLTKTQNTFEPSPVTLKKAAVSAPLHAEPELPKQSSAPTLLHKFVEAHRALSNYK